MNMRIRIAIASLVITTASTKAVEPMLTLRVSTPLIASVAGGLRFGDGGEELAPAIEAEAGIGGGKFAVGMNSLGNGKTGYGIKAAFLRSWIEPANIDEDQSFLGVEGELSIQRLVLNLGGYRRITSGDDDWLVSAGLGFLF